MAKKKRTKKETAKALRDYQKGGLLKGPSHEEGGIIVEAEGNEYIVNDSINGAASKHREGLEGLNENPDDYEIVKKDSILMAKHGGKIPVFDARKRSKNNAKSKR